MFVPIIFARQRHTEQPRRIQIHSTAAWAAFALSGCLLAIGGANAQNAAKKSASQKAAGITPGSNPSGVGKSSNLKVTAAPTPALLTYQFTPGSTYYYRLSALFDGHIPPFAQPDSPPIHIKVDLVYVATVKKVDKTGATVEFNVESSDLSLFDHEVKENEKVDPDKVTTFPLALEDVQKALNATAVLRTDGSVANILTTSSVKVPLDVGFDIRKLFLLLMPVTLANQPVKTGDMWPSTDGVLGSKAGRITYSNKLAGAQLKGKETDYTLNQTATSVVEDKLNKEGNSTTNDADVYRTLAGKIDLNAEMLLATPSPVSPAPLLGQVKSAHVVMNANVNRKRVKEDPDHPEIPENDPLDVKARITVARENAPGKNKIAEEKPKKNADKPVVPGEKTAQGTR